MMRGEMVEYGYSGHAVWDIAVWDINEHQRWDEDDQGFKITASRGLATFSRNKTYRL
jgi:hypothetical protein